MHYTFDDFKYDYSEDEDYIEKEDELAFMHTLCTADGGNAEMQYVMGYLYRDGGRGVKIDIRKAEYWFKRSAENGYSNAQCSLADILFERGELIPAFEWYHKAAINGNYYAQHKVGLAYFKGLGVERNPDEAGKWFLEGAKGGYPIPTEEKGV